MGPESNNSTLTLMPHFGGRPPKPVVRIPPPLMVPPLDGRTVAPPTPPDERIVVEPKPLFAGLAPENELGARTGCEYTCPVPPLPVVGRAWDVKVAGVTPPRYTIGLLPPALPPSGRLVAPVNCAGCEGEPR